MDETTTHTIGISTPCPHCKNHGVACSVTVPHSQPNQTCPVAGPGNPPGQPFQCRVCWVAKGMIGLLQPSKPRSGFPLAPSQVVRGYGPGTELKAILDSLGLNASGSCRCEAYATQMNQWGLEGCQQRRDEIISHLRTEQAKLGWIDRLRAVGGAVRTKLFLHIDWLDPAPGIVDEALRRVREHQAKQSASSNTGLVTNKRNPYPILTSPTITPRNLVWAYGVTTVPERQHDLLPRTLYSLQRAGFGEPRLFVDNSDGSDNNWARIELPLTCRYPNIGVAGNWILSMWELYIRNPFADRYAIFQDDVLAYVNLRQYLDQCTFPGEQPRDSTGSAGGTLISLEGIPTPYLTGVMHKGYWNLYSEPRNEVLASTNPATGEKMVGWHRSNQLGKGALGLVFNREGLVTLLSSRHLVERCQGDRREKTIDGGIVTSMTQAGWVEYVHYPSLMQHTGVERSSAGNARHKPSESFRGEEYDALQLLPQKGLTPR